MGHFYISIEIESEAFEFYKALWKTHGIDGIRVGTMTEGIKRAVEIEKSATDDLCFIAIVAENIDYIPQLKILSKETNAPILIAAHNYSDDEHDNALENGADFYGEYCFEPKKNVRRVLLIMDSIEQRSKKRKSPNGLIVHNDILIVNDSNKAFINNIEIAFTGSEMKILRYLTINRGIILSHESIYNVAKDNKYSELTPDSIYGAVKRMRKKIKEATQLDYIETKRDFGYRLRTISELFDKGEVL